DAAGARSGLDQLLEGGPAIAHDERKILQRQREDPPGRLARSPDVEHAGLALVGDELLEDDALATRKYGKIGGEVIDCRDHADPGAAAANIRLRHERELDGRRLQAR